MTTTLTGHVVGIGFGRLDPDADEDNAWIDDGHTYVTVRLDDDDATVSGGHTTITWDQPAAEHVEGERLGVGNADTGDISAEPSDDEVRAAAEALDGHSWMTDPDEGSLCACGEALAPGLEYAGDAYRSHIARAALVAAREAAGR